jgi:hypothetical protein
LIGDITRMNMYSQWAFIDYRISCIIHVGNCQKLDWDCCSRNPVVVNICDDSMRQYQQFTAPERGSSDIPIVLAINDLILFTSPHPKQRGRGVHNFGARLFVILALIKWIMPKLWTAAIYCVQRIKDLIIKIWNIATCIRIGAAVLHNNGGFGARQPRSNNQNCSTQLHSSSF